MNARSWAWLVLIGCWAFARPQLTAAAQDEDLGEDVGEEEQPKSAEDAPAAEEGAAEAQEAPEAVEAGATPAAASDADTGPTLRARAAFGMGAGTRWMRRPVMGGEQVMPTAVFPAADIGMSVRLWPQAAFAFDIALRYQTSLGLTLEENPLFALPNEVAVRAEHVELGVAPNWRMSDGIESGRFSVPVGMTLRNFWPAVHQLQTPRYTLFGPFVRVELDFPLGSVARLRFGPEAQMFFVAGTDLTDYGIGSPGFAIGAEASLDFRLTERFLIELRYRQSNALASSEGSTSFLDVERFLTACLAGEM